MMQQRHFPVSSDCPLCHTTKFRVLARGGLAANWECENGHLWEVSVFGWDRLDEHPMASTRRLEKA